MNAKLVTQLFFIGYLITEMLNRLAFDILLLPFFPLLLLLWKKFYLVIVIFEFHNDRFCSNTKLLSFSQFAKLRLPIYE